MPINNGSVQQKNKHNGTNRTCTAVGPSDRQDSTKHISVLSWHSTHNPESTAFVTRQSVQLLLVGVHKERRKSSSLHFEGIWSYRGAQLTSSQRTSQSAHAALTYECLRPTGGYISRCCRKYARHIRKVAFGCEPFSPTDIAVKQDCRHRDHHLQRPTMDAEGLSVQA